MKVLVAVFFSFGLAACSGGGGASSSSVAAPIGGGVGGGTGGGSGGGTVSNDGSAAYYGLATDSATPYSNVISPTATSGFVIANQFAMNVRDLNARKLDFYIYQPTCVIGALTEIYSAVLISGSNTSPMAGVMTISASGLTFQPRSLSLSETTAYNYGSLQSTVGGCTNGVRTLANGQSFSNGKIALWRTSSGDLYMGAVQTQVVASSSDLDSSSGTRTYSRYIHILNGAMQPNQRLSTWTTSSIGQVDSNFTAFYTSRGASSFGNTTNSGSWTNLSTTAGNSSAIATTMKDSGGSAAPFVGFAAGNLGGSGKALVVQSSRFSASNQVTSTDGTNTLDLLGAGSIMIHVQQ